MQDLIIIGGSYAGMAAALQLVRARRKVTVIDAGQRRNRFASHSHGFLGQDGVDPARIWASAQAQVMAYPTLTWIDGRAHAIGGARDDFHVETTDGQKITGRRILFANGVTDTLPDISGLADRWGKTVFHCPYCHGYELNAGKIGVIATGPMSLHQAQLLPEWGEVTFLTNGVIHLTDTERDDITQRGVEIDTTPISDITGDADVRLGDGRLLHFAGLFIATRVAPSSPLAEQLGCALMETPMGQQIATAESKETTVAGAFACGDTARVPHSVSLAVADGAWAGMQIHRSLVWPNG